MRTLLASPLGFLIGLSLGAFGAGGSILAVPALIHGAGEDTRSAIATSLLLVGSAALVGVIAHARAGRVRVPIALLFGLAGVPGAMLGTALHRGLNADVLLLGFSVLMVVAAWRMLTACPSCTQVGERAALATSSSDIATVTVARARLDTAAAVKIVAAGTGVGFLTGLFGVGGGFVIVPTLTLVLGLAMPEAIGTSLLVVAINCAVALSLRVGDDTIDWAVAIPFTLAGIAGVLVGKRVADRLDPTSSLRWFSALLVAVAVFTATAATYALVV
jgi:uncharacterized membrane protein YfcA